MLVCCTIADSQTILTIFVSSMPQFSTFFLILFSFSSVESFMGTEEQGLQNIVKTHVRQFFFSQSSLKLLIVFIIESSVITKVDADIRHYIL